MKLVEMRDSNQPTAPVHTNPMTRCLSESLGHQLHASSMKLFSSAAKGFLKPMASVGPGRKGVSLEGDDRVECK